MVQNQGVRSLAYAGTIGLVGLLDGCTSSKYHQTNLEEPRANHYSQIEQQSEKKFYPRPSSAMMTRPDGKEWYRYVLIDVNNATSPEDTTNATPFEPQVAILRDLETNPLPIDGEEMKSNYKREGGRPMKHMIFTSRYGGPNTNKQKVYVSLNVFLDCVTQPGFAERISPYWSPDVGNWKVMTPEQERGLSNSNTRQQTIEKMLKEKEN